MQDPYPALFSLPQLTEPPKPMLKTVSLREGVMPFLPPGIREVRWCLHGAQDTAGSPRSKQFRPVPSGWASLASQALLPRTVLTHLFVNTHAMYVSV